MSAIAGVFPVLPTIFHDDGSVDVDGFEAVVDFVLAAGVDGVVFPGLASEYEHLTLDEREQLIAVVGRVVGDRARYVVGAGADNLADSVRLAQAGARAGAVAAMVMTPKWVGPEIARQVEFYVTLGQQADLPIMVQNAPAPMGLGLSVAALLAIAGETDAVRWFKEENMPCGQRITGLLADRPPHLDGVFGGAGGRYITDELARGAIGTMPAAETPEVHVALHRAHRAGDETVVRDLYEAVLPILMMQATFRWRLTKEVLRRRGLIASSHTRAPGPEFDAGDHAELGRILARLAERTRPLLPAAELQTATR